MICSQKVPFLAKLLFMFLNSVSVGKNVNSTIWHVSIFMIVRHSIPGVFI